MINANFHTKKFWLMKLKSNKNLDRGHSLWIIIQGNKNGVKCIFEWFKGSY